MGFLNFILSIPILFLSIGAFKNNSHFFYLLSILLFFSHTFVYGIVTIIILLFYITSEVKQTKKMLFTLLFLCFILFTLLLDDGLSHNFFSMLSPENIIKNLVNNLLFVTGSSFQFFLPDYCGFFGFILVMILYGKQLVWDYSYDKTTLFVVVFLLLLIFFTPVSIPLFGGAWYSFSSRFIFLMIFFTITDLRLHKNVGNVLILLFLFLLIFKSLTLLNAYEKTDNRLRTNYEPIVKALPSDKRIYILDETNYTGIGFRMSNYTYGLNPFEHYITGYYSIKGGFSSGYFGGYCPYWTIKYVRNIYLPPCRRVVKICVLCDDVGELCYIKGTDKRVSVNYSLNESIVCVKCKRLMGIECYDYLPNATNISSENGECIACEIQNISCYLNNNKIQEGFDYLVIFGDTIDEIEIADEINYSIYARTNDVIVYKIEKYN